MPTRTSDAEWHGSLHEGNGKMRFGSGAYEGAFTWSSRFEHAKGTNPEELIAAAHAGCFSMALADDLGKAGFKPDFVRTEAIVHIDKLNPGGWTITWIELICGAGVPGIDDAAFQKIAEGTKASCPVSKALRAVEITLDASLKT